MRIKERIKSKLSTIKYFVCEKHKHTQISLSSSVTNCRFEGDNYIGEHTIVSDCMIGKFSYISHDCELVGVQIGKFTSIAPQCKVLIGNHPTTKFVTTHPAIYSKIRLAGRCLASENYFNEYKYADIKNKKNVIIGNDVWIASDVKILGGVRIEDGAIIAAGAVVTKDVPPYTIVAGVPAKKIGSRFDDFQIEYLLNFQWWNRKESWIKENIDHFLDVDEFLRWTKSYEQ